MRSFIFPEKRRQKHVDVCFEKERIVFEKQKTVYVFSLRYYQSGRNEEKNNLGWKKTIWKGRTNYFSFYPNF
jgi:hypothetical protein